jgi:GTP cyclohydrolase IA
MSASKAAAKAVVKVMPAKTSITSSMKEVLDLLGEDTSREGLRRTPERWEKAMRFLTSGYGERLETIVNGAIYRVKCDEMVIVKDIEFFSMCEHHLLPFFGKIHVAYLPKDKVIGLSKIPRIVNMYARRMQLQERLTQQVAEAVESAISPRGVAVMSEARHFCMMMRGVEKQHSGAITSTMLGAFRSNKATRDEFLALVARPS